jgi:flagellar basal-body rod modification protein FlgD
MTTISATTALDSGSYSTQSTTSTASEIQDQFLTLLLTQLQNQDPTDPMDTDSFTSQLCSINQLEQSVITNDYLANLESAASTSQAVSYIGKSVNVEGNTVNINEDNTGDIAFKISDDAADASINIYDANGNTVWNEEMTDLSSGTYTVSLDDLDKSMAGGTYTYSVSAYDEKGNTLDVTTYSSVEITGLVYEDGEPYLVTNSGTISMDDVTELHQS